MNHTLHLHIHWWHWFITCKYGTWKSFKYHWNNIKPSTVEPLPIIPACFVLPHILLTQYGPCKSDTLRTSLHLLLSPIYPFLPMVPSETVERGFHLTHMWDLTFSQQSQRYDMVQSGINFLPMEEHAGSIFWMKQITQHHIQKTLFSSLSVQMS
jgi:hypothetical protein